MDKYRLRRAILDALKDLEPGACSLDELALFPTLAQAGATREAVLDEARGLEAHAFITDLSPTRAPVWRLTAAGRDQITQDARLDRYVWGTLAL